MKRRSFLTNFWLLGGSLIIPTFLNSCRKEDLITGKQQFQANLNNLQKTNQLEKKLKKAAENYRILNKCWDCNTIFFVSSSDSLPRSRRLILKKFKTERSINFNVEGIIYKDKSQTNKNKLSMVNIEGEAYSIKVYKKPRNITIPLNSSILSQKSFSYIPTDMINASINIQTIKL